MKEQSKAIMKEIEETGSLSYTTLHKAMKDVFLAGLRQGFEWNYVPLSFENSGDIEKDFKKLLDEVFK